jgi:hypothetical protein
MIMIAIIFDLQIASNDLASNELASNDLGVFYDLAYAFYACPCLIPIVYGIEDERCPEHYSNRDFGFVGQIFGCNRNDERHRNVNVHELADAFHKFVHKPG